MIDFARLKGLIMRSNQGQQRGAFQPFSPAGIVYNTLTIVLEGILPVGTGSEQLLAGHVLSVEESEINQNDRDIE